MLKNISGTGRLKEENNSNRSARQFLLNLLLTTVLMDLTRLSAWDFTVGGSNACCWTELDPHPTKQENLMSWSFFQTCFWSGNLHFAKNLSSCKTQTAFRHSSVASSSDHRVNILAWFNNFPITLKRKQNLPRKLFRFFFSVNCFSKNDFLTQFDKTCKYLRIAASETTSSTCNLQVTPHLIMAESAVEGSRSRER